MLCPPPRKGFYLERMGLFQLRWCQNFSNDVNMKVVAYAAINYAGYINSFLFASLRNYVLLMFSSYILDIYFFRHGVNKIWYFKNKKRWNRLVTIHDKSYFYYTSISSISLGAPFWYIFSNIGGAIPKFVAILRCMRNITPGGSVTRKVGTNYRLLEEQDNTAPSP